MGEITEVDFSAFQTAVEEGIYDEGLLEHVGNVVGAVPEQDSSKFCVGTLLGRLVRLSPELTLRHTEAYLAKVDNRAALPFAVEYAQAWAEATLQGYPNPSNRHIYQLKVWEKAPEGSPLKRVANVAWQMSNDEAQRHQSIEQYLLHNPILWPEM